ncbi:hypothetical protein E2C01_032383 [Portunus trituberculatus]|uniref:Uncharacterized protein n=1 Tax=Portunus trituberculatus TaxID=210409 RepID=A0A5B7F053_PORTR|nr:hypothetical protein [Portunus trituberculatus]
MSPESAANKHELLRSVHRLPGFLLPRCGLRGGLSLHRTDKGLWKNSLTIVSGIHDCLHFGEELIIYVFVCLALVLSGSNWSKVKG